MHNIPTWGLALVYWLHMLATIVWVGSLTCLALLVYPAARQSLSEAVYRLFVAKIQSRLQLVGWLCLLVLVATGLFQMSANPNYLGFMAISNPWAVAIFLKHIAIAMMVVLSIYLTWFVNPAMERAVFKESHGDSQTETLDALQRREKQLLWINFGIAVLVLALTALARVS